MNTELELVIFDCDGVLVDSEALVAGIYSDFFHQHNVMISPEELGVTYAGKTDFDLISDIKKRFHDHNLPEDAQEQVQQIAKLRMETELTPILGVKTLLETSNFRKCVCSNSGYKRLMQSLEVTGILDLFKLEHIFSASFVENAKPAPDLHLLAAQEMQADPVRCIVIEDSVTGIQAAKTAGMQAIGFTGAGHLDASHAERLHDHGADAVFATMQDLQNYLKTLSFAS